MEQSESKSEKLRRETKELRREVSKQTIGYIVSALGLIAGLAWNEAIKQLIEYLSPANSNTIIAKFIYAAVITLIVAVVSFYLVRWAKKEEE